MAARDGFTTCEAANESLSDRAERFRITGRDVTAVAFIPTAHNRHDLGPSALCEVSDVELGRALDLLLQSGNPEPELAFAGPEAYLASLRRRAYRAALAVVRPCLWLNKDGLPARVSFRMLDARVGVGSTPLRQEDGDASRAEAFLHGVGSVSDKSRNRVRFGEDAAEIVHWQRFSLPSPTQLYGRFPRAQHAPYGFIRVTYVLKNDGHAEAHLSCSYMPSVWFYRDHRRELAYDMREASALEIERFLVPDKDIPSGTTWMELDTSTGYARSLD